MSMAYSSQSQQLHQQLWTTIISQHIKYLDEDDEHTLTKHRRALENQMYHFLCTVRHDRKFFLPSTLRVLHESILSDAGSLDRIGQGFLAIHQYANNLWRSGWRQEFRTILTYCGYYRQEICANVAHAECLFEEMGYRRCAGTLQLLRKPCDDQIANVSRDALAAYVECQIMKDIGDGLTKLRHPTTILDVFAMRQTMIGNVQQTIETMLPTPLIYANQTFGDSHALSYPAAARHQPHHQPFGMSHSRSLDQCDGHAINAPPPLIDACAAGKRYSTSLDLPGGHPGYENVPFTAHNNNVPYCNHHQYAIAPPARTAAQPDHITGSPHILGNASAFFNDTVLIPQSSHAPKCPAVDHCSAAGRPAPLHAHNGHQQLRWLEDELKQMHLHPAPANRRSLSGAKCAQHPNADEAYAATSSSRGLSDFDSTDGEMMLHSGSCTNNNSSPRASAAGGRLAGEHWEFVYSELERTGYSKDLVNRGNLAANVGRRDENGAAVAHRSVSAQRRRTADALPEKADGRKSFAPTANEAHGACRSAGNRLPCGSARSTTASAVERSARDDRQPAHQAKRHSGGNAAAHAQRRSNGDQCAAAATQTHAQVPVEQPPVVRRSRSPSAITHWSCEFCTLLNPMDRRVCLACAKTNGIVGCNSKATTTCV